MTNLFNPDILEFKPDNDVYKFFDNDGLYDLQLKVTGIDDNSMDMIKSFVTYMINENMDNIVDNIETNKFEYFKGTDGYKMIDSGNVRGNLDNHRIGDWFFSDDKLFNNLVGRDISNSQGKFAKRLTKALKNYCGLNLKKLDCEVTNKNDETIKINAVSHIGNLVNKATTKTTNYHIDLTYNLDWDAGDYGDSGSCYWNDHIGARQMIENTTGGAVRFYTKDDNNYRGHGRMFILPYTENKKVLGFVIFNSYGGKLAARAKIMEQLTGLKSKPVRFTNNGQSTGKLWINGTEGYYLYKEDNSITEIDMSIDTCQSYNGEHSHPNTCDKCGDGFDLDYSGAWVDENTTICQHCLDLYYTQCDDCGNYDHDNDAQSLANDSNAQICSDCAVGDFYYNCEHCEGLEHIDNMNHASDKLLCYSCHDENSEQCNSCDEYIFTEDDSLTAIHDGDTVCDDCLQDYELCDYCKHWHMQYDTLINGKKIMCHECYQSSNWHKQHVLFWINDMPELDTMQFNPWFYVETLAVSPNRIEV